MSKINSKLIVHLIEDMRRVSGSLENSHDVWYDAYFTATRHWLHRIEKSLQGLDSNRTELEEIDSEIFRKSYGSGSTFGRPSTGWVPNPGKTYQDNIGNMWTWEGEWTPLNLISLRSNRGTMWVYDTKTFGWEIVRRVPVHHHLPVAYEPYTEYEKYPSQKNLPDYHPDKIYQDGRGQLWENIDGKWVSGPDREVRARFRKRGRGTKRLFSPFTPLKYVADSTENLE